LNLAAAIEIQFLSGEEHEANGGEGEDDSAGAENEQELAAEPVNKRDADHGHSEVDDREEHVAPVRLEIGESALEKDAGVIEDDGVDACAVLQKGWYKRAGRE